MHLDNNNISRIHLGRIVNRQISTQNLFISIPTNVLTLGQGQFVHMSDWAVRLGKKREILQLLYHYDC